MQRVLIRSICLLLSVFLSAFPAASEEYFLVRVDDERKSDETEVQLLERLGFIYMRSVDSGRREVHLVSAPYELSKSFIRELKRSERRLRNIELVEDLYLTDMVENEARASAFKGALDYAEAIASQGSKKENFHGAKVLRGYAKQRLVDILDFDSIHRHYGTGDGVIAVIDTGVDPFHPGLVGSLVPGYDFIFDEPGYASEWRELDPELSQQLMESGSGSVDQSSVAILSQSSVAILNQSSVAILSQSSVAILSQPEYQSFGHGTMVAGAIRLAVPTAKIMPLKAFGPDGTASTADIVDAIYFAVANGADVINMSFSLRTFSEETMRAINHATRQGVICISAAGNLGTETLVYPAALANVTGVAAVTEDQELSSVSNYGEDLVSLATFGEALVTTYPGGLYASVFGTSFSTAIVSGAVAIFREIDENLDQHGAETALAMKRPRSGDLGHGVLELEAALKMFKKKKR